VTHEERAASFAKEREAQLRAGVRKQRETAADVRKQLEIAARIIREVLAGAPSDYRRWQLGELQSEVTRALAAVTKPATDSLVAGLAESWAGGAALIDGPLAAAGVEISAQLVALDPRMLDAMREFGAERMKDITAKVAARINGEMAQAAIGTQTPFQAAQKVASIVEEGGMRRATTVVRDGLGRAYSAATQQRHEQAKAVLPELQKQWRRSGKLHSRFGHDKIDGQIRDVDKPFDLPGGVQLMFPRDPAGPIEETINCGCTSLPFMKSWKVSVPEGSRFTAEEVKGDRNKRVLAELRGER
jgi:hypothetical protein